MNSSPPIIASLPPELLIEIFELARPKIRALHKLPFEVVLSHVSSSWRNLALATRILWRRIDIYSLRSLERLPHYLQRSGTLISLDIYIDLYKEDRFIAYGSQRKREMIVQLIANAVLPHIHRARTLFIITCYESTAITLLSNFINSSAPDLNSLQIAFGHLCTTPRGPGIKVFTRGLPQLTFLKTDLPNCLPPLALQNLTTLHLHMLTDSLNLSYQSFVDMITAPRHLSQLSLQGSMTVSASDWPSDSSWPGFVMSNLKSLRLQDGGMFALRMLLLMFAPSLESLWLDYSFNNFGHLFNAPDITQPTRFPALKYLTIPTYGFSNHTNFSKVFPTITHLHLPHANFFRDDRLADFLLGQWRYLHTFVVSMIRESQSSGFHRALCRFLPYRRDAGYPICKLLVDEDLFRMLKKERPDISGEVGMGLLSLETYREPWWIMSHERQRDDF
ncbi:hypothetical protein BYT27DRAFT_7167962 [Phlegmacium glaucopus]|nr:hypothetical protein BYT27DRAFT_7167962 [Phlegmacium glaucopus]